MRGYMRLDSYISSPIIHLETAASIPVKEKNRPPDFRSFSEQFLALCQTLAAWSNDRAPQLRHVVYPMEKPCGWYEAHQVHLRTQRALCNYDQGSWMHAIGASAPNISGSAICTSRRAFWLTAPPSTATIGAPLESLHRADVRTVLLICCAYLFCSAIPSQGAPTTRGSGCGVNLCATGWVDSPTRAVQCALSFH